MKKTTVINSKNTTRKAVLWIISPFIVLFIGLLFNILFRAIGINVAIVNVISALLGISGALLIFIGPIYGISLLLRKK